MIQPIVAAKHGGSSKEQAMPIKEVRLYAKLSFTRLDHEVTEIDVLALMDSGSQPIPMHLVRMLADFPATDRRSNRNAYDLHAQLLEATDEEWQRRSPQWFLLSFALEYEDLIITWSIEDIALTAINGSLV
jgi:hypothetical protein